MNLFCIVPYSVEGWIPPAPARLKSFLKGHDIDSEVFVLNLEIFIQTVFSILVIIFWALIIYIENKHSMSFLNIDNLVETVYFKNNK